MTRACDCVVIVDDDPTARALLGAYLEALGLHGILCADVDAAAATLSRLGEVAAIFLDVRMPDLSRYRLRRFAHTWGVRKGIPVYLASCIDEDGLLDLASVVGAAGILPKPITATAVTTTLKHAGLLPGTNVDVESR